MSIERYSKEEMALRALEKRWDEAIALGDTSTLNDIIDSDYLVTGMQGEINSKEQILKAVSSSVQLIRSSNRDEIDIRIYGDTAIVTGRVTWSVPNKFAGNRSTETSKHARYIKVYIKRENEWKVVLAQATRISNLNAVSISDVK
jgi:ketosteroid isomerase-like protein